MFCPINIGGYFWGGNIAGMIAGFIFFALLVTGIVLLIIRFTRSGSPAAAVAEKGNKGPLGILDERYSRGEISKQEYEDVKKDITSE